VFRRGVFLDFLPPGLHVFVRPPDEAAAITFDRVTPVAGAELEHAASDAIVRHPDATRYLRVVQVESGSLGLLHVDGVFARRLRPGRHLLFETGHVLRVDTARAFEPIVATDPEALLAHPDFAGTLLAVEVKDHERGLVFAGDNFRRFLAPGKHVFARVKTPPLRVETVDVSEPEVRHPDARTLARAPDAPAHLTSAAITQGQVGLLFVDGILRTRLPPGVHVFWNGLRAVRVQVVDLREVGLEVQGQELLTADKVSLRLNVSVRYRLVDVDRAILEHADHAEALHRALQLALREEVQRLTLDELLSRKEDIGAALAQRAAAGAAAVGVEIRSAGLRDVILPGEMRQILNHVVEAERRAQANLITRREETAATRSLLNTARLLDENPTLMRLKELEHAERIAEKIASLSVIGGIDAIVPKIREALTAK
jgi:regulator of protease activity HflC (stomatin/prohibitin superfamily)